MKINSILYPLLAAVLQSDEVFSAKYKSKPSGSKPSAGSSPVSRPSSPSSPSISKPSVKTPNGPISSTTRSAFNPSPSFKPLSTSGAPTVRSGGGGYGSATKIIAGVAAGAAVTIAAGYFLYGGRHSSPYCRGDDMDRFMSGRCPRGQSSQSHQCKTQIPLCPIPELVRGKWNLGSNALPKVDALFDRSVCSVVALSSTSAPSSNFTSAPSSNTTLVSMTGVEGKSELDSCLRRIVAAGGCSSYGTGNMFQYDDNSGTCGCCSSAQVTTLADDNFQSAIYAHREANDLGGVAPKHCISGSIMYYPDIAGGADVAHACECGACTNCGAGGPRYMDWSGPYVVPDTVGNISFVDAAKTQPLYDPVDTCLCDDMNLSECELETFSAATAAGGSFSSNIVVVSSAVLFFLHFIRRH